MTICRQCGTIFAPKRTGQILCGMICRQQNNGHRRKGQKTGPQKWREYKMRVTRDGHLKMYAGKHPFADGRKEMHVHDMLMELHLGRRLLPTECVHHRNEDKTDNRLENLELMTHSQHSSTHMKEIAATKPRTRGGRFA